jgi:hypothetical protein
MSLQQVVNLSSSLTINRRKMVGVAYSRSQIPRTDMTVTKNPWRFTLSVPAQPWIDMRATIEALDHLDRYSPQTISMNDNPDMAWMFRYQGDNPTTPVDISVVSFNGDQLVLDNLPNLNDGNYLFRAGDFIQIEGKPFPFTVVSDVTRGTGQTVTVTTHRPNIITGSVQGLTINVGTDVQFSMFCPNMPTYKLSPGAYRVTQLGERLNNAIVEWDDDFQLYEWVAGA